MNPAMSPGPSRSPDQLPREAMVARLAALEAGTMDEGWDRAILAAMEDGAPAVRERAIRLAARYLEPAVLVELVADGANAVRRNAGLSALERQGPYALPDLVGLLAHAEAELTMFALQTLTRIGDTAAARAMLPLVHHSDPNVAQSAVEAVGRLRSPDAVTVLLPLLKGDLWIQLASISALGEIGDARAIEPLVALIPDSIVADTAVEALQQIASPDSLEPLLALLPRVRERSLRDAIMLALGVVIEMHPDPGPLARRYARDYESEGGDVLSYLSAVLVPEATTPGPGSDSDSLLLAATTLAVVAGLREHIPTVLGRLGADPSAIWIEALALRYPEGITPLLGELLQDPDPTLRCGALRAGWFTKSDLPVLLDQLADPDVAVRAAACHALGRLSEDATAPLLMERLRRGLPMEQEAAAEALSRFPATALTELESCLESGRDPSVLAHALGVLARQPVACLEPRVLATASHENPAIRSAALRAASVLPGTRADVALIRALADGHEPIRVEALALLSRRGGEKTVPLLAALLGTSDSLRYHVIRALGQMRAAGAGDRLRALYQECAPHERVEVMQALIRIAPSWLRGFLHERLAEGDLDVRRLAVLGLAELADPSDLALLVDLARDHDWNVRNEVARGLGKTARPETRDTLLALARDVEPVVAATARAALDLLPRDRVRLSA